MKQGQWKRTALWITVFLGTADFAWGGYESSYAKARQAVDKGRWQNAVEHLNEAIGSKPEAGGEMVRIYGVSFEPYLPYYYLGLAHYHLGDHPNALSAWDHSEAQGVVTADQNWARLRKLRQEIRRPDPPPTVPPTPTETSGPPGPALLPPGQALVVGVSNYRGSAWTRLPGVLEDVPVVTQALKEQGFNVQVLEDPTKDQLIQAVEELFLKAYESSRLLFYYAGHGVTLSTHGAKRGYLVPVDAPSPSKDEGSFKLKALSLSRFQEWVDESKARHMIFLFDSCFSGSVFNVVRSGELSASSREKIEGRSRLFITAGDADDEVPDKSLFRRAFVEGLEGAADANSDGWIFGLELAAYIADQVVDRGRRAGYDQTPQWGRGERTSGDFPVRAKHQ